MSLFALLSPPRCAGSRLSAPPVRLLLFTEEYFPIQKDSQPQRILCLELIKRLRAATSYSNASRGCYVFFTAIFIIKIAISHLLLNRLDPV